MLKTNVLIPGLVLLLVIAAATALVVFNPFSGKGEKIIEDSFAKLWQEKSFRIKGDVGLEFKSEESGAALGQEIQVSIAFEEKLINDKENPKAETEINGEVGMQGITMKFGGKVINVNKNIYFTVSTLPSLPVSGIDLNEIKNQWFKISQSALLEGTEAASASQIDEKKLAEELKALVLGKNIFEIKKNLGKEELAGRGKANHYLAEIRKEAVKELVPGLLDLAKNYIGQEEMASYEEQMTQFRADFEKNFEPAWQKIAPLEVEFWLESGSRLRKIAFEKEINYTDQESGANVSIKTDVNLEFSDFNEKFEIIEPTDAKPIEDLLGQLLNPANDLEEYDLQNYNIEGLENLDFENLE